MKCESCCSDRVIKFFDNFDTREKDFKGHNIIVKDVEQYRCEECEDSWISANELKRIRSEIDKLKYETLSPAHLKAIRESLPISSKKGLSDFLCLNEKAFVKWEKGYTELNRANDLLIRLIARSKENFDFVQELHDKKFKFEIGDYFFLKSIVAKEVKTEPASVERVWEKLKINGVKVSNVEITPNPREDKAA